MSARHVLRDALLEQGETPADERELLHRAAAISPAIGAAIVPADPVTRALAAEVRLSLTEDEVVRLLFPSHRR